LHWQIDIKYEVYSVKRPMKNIKDNTLTDLVKKKKQLLDALLKLSIKAAIGETNPESAVGQRAKLLSDLVKNDEAILSREEQTGIKAHQQEEELFESIVVVIKSIEDNNRGTINRLEKESRDAEIEKSKLKLNKKITNYVHQTKSYSRFHDGSGRLFSEKGVVKGIL